MERVTFHQSTDGKPTTDNHAELADRFAGILRASRFKTAGRPHEGRNQVAIPGYESKKDRSQTTPRGCAAPLVAEASTPMPPSVDQTEVRAHPASETPANHVRASAPCEPASPVLETTAWRDSCEPRSRTASLRR